MIEFESETIKQASEMMIFWTTNEFANKTAKRTIKEMATMLIRAKIVNFSRSLAFFFMFPIAITSKIEMNMGMIKSETKADDH